MDVDLEWQAPYHALLVLSKVLSVFPDLTTRFDKIIWPPIMTHLLFPHAWVRTASCRLLGSLFSAVPVAPPSFGLPSESPLSRTGMRDAAGKLCLQLKSEHLDAALRLQVVKNLFYIGKCFCSIPVGEGASAEVEAEDDSDDIEDNNELSHQDPMPWLFSKLSYQARSAHIARRNKSVHQVRYFIHLTPYDAHVINSIIGPSSPLRSCNGLQPWLRTWIRQD